MQQSVRNVRMYVKIIYIYLYVYKLTIMNSNMAHIKLQINTPTTNRASVYQRRAGDGMRVDVNASVCNGLA